jgi:hypothetical protein
MQHMTYAIVPALPNVERPSPWPFRLQDISPLAWWRTLPPDAFGEPDQLLLVATLRQISVFHGDMDLAAALRGDAQAAIQVALAAMPITEITLRVDIGMTALLSSALNRNAASALVMAQVIGLTDLDHSVETFLAASWFSHGLQHSSDPLKFSKAEAVLRAAIQERHGVEGKTGHPFEMRDPSRRSPPHE